MNTTVVDEVGSTQVITSEMDEAAFLRSQIVEIRRRKDGLYAERAEHANTEVQIRLLLELVDEMVMRSGAAPVWMTTEAAADSEETGACRDYDDFWNRTKYTVPEGVLAEDGSIPYTASVFLLLQRHKQAQLLRSDLRIFDRRPYLRGYHRAAGGQRGRVGG